MTNSTKTGVTSLLPAFHGAEALARMVSDNFTPNVSFQLGWRDDIKAGAARKMVEALFREFKNAELVSESCARPNSVRAVCMLDHSTAVRYCIAWLELPPKYYDFECLQVAINEWAQGTSEVVSNNEISTILGMAAAAVSGNPNARVFALNEHRNLPMKLMSEIVQQ